MTYFISQDSIDLGWDKFFAKGPGHYSCNHDFARIQKMKDRGYIPMWDRNRQKFASFKIVKQCDTVRGYIVQRRGVPRYWRHVVLHDRSSAKEDR
jgi:hypothetical protein